LLHGLTSFFVPRIQFMVNGLHVPGHTGAGKLLGGPPMFESANYPSGDQETAEERLWRAVIAKTLEEWIRGPLRSRRIAEQFLFHDERDFQAVCSSAGMDPQNLRQRLQSIRARVMPTQNGPTRATA
jgi:hypothetical protein